MKALLIVWTFYFHSASLTVTQFRTMRHCSEAGRALDAAWCDVRIQPQSHRNLRGEPLMPLYNVYRQFTPVTIRPPKGKDEGEHRAALINVGTVRADDGEDALQQARSEYGVLAPVVERVLH